MIAVNIKFQAMELFCTSLHKLYLRSFVQKIILKISDSFHKKALAEWLCSKIADTLVIEERNVFWEFPIFTVTIL